MWKVAWPLLLRSVGGGLARGMAGLAVAGLGRRTSPKWNTNKAASRPHHKSPQPLSPAPRDTPTVSSSTTHSTSFASLTQLRCACGTVPAKVGASSTQSPTAAQLSPAKTPPNMAGPIPGLTRLSIPGAHPQPYSPLSPRRAFTSTPPPGLLTSGSAPPRTGLAGFLPKPHRAHSGPRSPLSPRPPIRTLSDVMRHPGLRRWVLIAVALVLTVLGLKGAVKRGETAAQRVAGKPLAPAGEGAMAVAVEDELPPVVTRKAMDKLRLLEIHWTIQDQQSDAAQLATADQLQDSHHDGDLINASPKSPEIQHQKPNPPLALSDGHVDSPPLVAVIPEGGVRRPNLTGKLRRVPSSQLDREISPYPFSGFILPSYIGDQPHLAQEHLHQLGLLAIALNRTLVLPAVSKARMGSCQSFGFKMYWTKESVEDQLGVPTITFADFLDYAEQREDIASGQLVSMLPPSDVYEYGAVEVASSSDPLNIPGRGTRNSCLREDKSRIDFTPFSPLAIYPPPTYAKTYHFGESVIHTLSAVELGRKSSRLDNRDNWRPPTVLAINYEVRAPIITPDLAASFAPWIVETPRGFEPFEPAELWAEVGSQVSGDLPLKVGVSWQTERVKPENVEVCAGALVAQLEEIVREHPTLANVYLSTDLAIDDGNPISPSMARTISSEHRKAAELFKVQFAKRLPNVDLLTYTRVERAEGVDLPPWLIAQIKKAGKKLFREGKPKPDGLHFGLGDLDLTLVGMVDDRILTEAEVVLVPGTRIDEEGEASSVCGVGMVGSQRVVNERWVSWAEQQDIGEDMEKYGGDGEGKERGGEAAKGEAEGEDDEDRAGKIWEVSRTWS